MDEGDIEGMAKYMVCLAKNSALAARLGQAARHRVNNEFSMAKSINELWDVVQSAIQEYC